MSKDEFIVGTATVEVMYCLNKRTQQSSRVDTPPLKTPPVLKNTFEAGSLVEYTTLAKEAEADFSKNVLFGKVIDVEAHDALIQDIHRGGNRGKVFLHHIRPCALEKVIRPAFEAGDKVLVGGMHGAVWDAWVVEANQLMQWTPERTECCDRVFTVQRIDVNTGYVYLRDCISDAWPPRFLCKATDKDIEESNRLQAGDHVVCDQSHVTTAPWLDSMTELVGRAGVVQQMSGVAGAYVVGRVVVVDFAYTGRFTFLPKWLRKVSREEFKAREQLWRSARDLSLLSNEVDTGCVLRLVSTTLGKRNRQNEEVRDK